MKNITVFDSPIITCLYYIFNLIDDMQPIQVTSQNFKNQRDNCTLKLMFLTMMITYLTEQGQEIVTSLDHLLFEFLAQTPKGIKNYNANYVKLVIPESHTPTYKDTNTDKRFKIGDKPIVDKEEDGFEALVESKKEQLTKLNADFNKDLLTPTNRLFAFFALQSMNGTGYESEYTEMSDYSGMEETTYRKYLKNMHAILNIDDKSRFINILTMVRPLLVRPSSEKAKEEQIIIEKNDKKQADIITKKCKGARDTLIFGETLINANGTNCEPAAAPAPSPPAPSPPAPAPSPSSPPSPSPPAPSPPQQPASASDPQSSQVVPQLNLQAIPSGGNKPIKIKRNGKQKQTKKKSSKNIINKVKKTLRRAKRKPAT